MPEEAPWTALIRAGGPASGAVLLVAVGAYGGTQAAQFKPPFDDYASWICLFLMAIGGLIATVQIGTTAYRSSFSAERAQSEPLDLP